MSLKGYTGDLGCSWTWKLLRRIQPTLWQTYRWSPPTQLPTYEEKTRVIWGTVVCFCDCIWKSLLTYFLSSLSYCSCVKSKGKQALTLFSCLRNTQVKIEFNCKALIWAKQKYTISLTLDQNIVITITRWAVIVKNRAGTRLLTADILDDNLLLLTQNRRNSQDWVNVDTL